MNKDELEEILRKTIGVSKGETEAVVLGGRSYVTAFANNYIHRNVGENNYTLSIRVAFGKRVGSVTVNDFNEGAIEDAVKRAEEIAKSSSEIPDFVSFAKPEEVPERSFFLESTEQASPSLRAEYVKKIIDTAKEKGLNANGTFTTEEMALGVANSLGVMRISQLTTASLKSVIMSDTSSGYSLATSIDINDISVDSVIKESVSLALSGKNPLPIEPGKYEVILSPYAFSEFLSSLCYLTFNARAVEECSSFFLDNFGKKMFPEHVTIYDDGLSSETIPMPFDFEGVPKKRVYFIKNGVITDVVYDTLTAYKVGRESTGHSLPQPSDFSPYPMNVIMEGGSLARDEIISHVEKGLYVHRFWYTNPMDPRRAVITGMTRDGLFLIEGGKITKPVKNMRFTESAIDALANCVEVSKEKKINYEGTSITVPYVRIKDFTFTSATEF